MEGARQPSFDGAQCLKKQMGQHVKLEILFSKLIFYITIHIKYQIQNNLTEGRLNQVYDPIPYGSYHPLLTLLPLGIVT